MNELEVSIAVYVWYMDEEGEYVKQPLVVNGRVTEWNDYTTAHLYVRFVDYDLDEPQKTISYYPLGRYKLGAVKHLDGKQAYRGGIGVYGCEGLNFRMVDGGGTVPEWVETRPVEKPKRKGEYQWRWGRWEKYLKTKGWVPA